MIRGGSIELSTKISNDCFLKSKIKITLNYVVLLSVNSVIKLSFQSGYGLKSAFHSLDFLFSIFSFFLVFKAKSHNKHEVAALAPVLRPTFRSDCLLFVAALQLSPEDPCNHLTVSRPIHYNLCCDPKITIRCLHFATTAPKVRYVPSNRQFLDTIASLQHPTSYCNKKLLQKQDQYP